MSAAEDLHKYVISSIRLTAEEDSDFYLGMARRQFAGSFIIAGEIESAITLLEYEFQRHHSMSSGLWLAAAHLIGADMASAEEIYIAHLLPLRKAPADRADSFAAGLRDLQAALIEYEPEVALFELPGGVGPDTGPFDLTEEFFQLPSNFSAQVKSVLKSNPRMNSLYRVD